MKKLLSISLCLCMLSGLMCACSEQPEELEESEESNEYQVHYYADITHDGIDDDICIDCEKIINDSQDTASIKVVTDNDNCIWNAELGLPHAGWAEYYLVKIDSDYYLFLYMPEESQGMYADYYKLFYVSAEGTETIVEEMSVFNVDESMLAEMREKYFNNANEYIDNGKLLISTWEGELIY